MPKRRRKETDIDLKDDPRVRDPVIWNRLKVMVMDDAIDRSWGCALYRLHRNEIITGEQREAGDRYHKIIEDFRTTQQKDPDECSELDRKRIEVAKRRREEMIELLGVGRLRLDDLILSDMYPTTEAAQRLIVALLESLAIFFNTGNKRRTQNVV